MGDTRRRQTNADKDTILIIGATGNVGRRVVAQLLRTGARVRVKGELNAE
jgi:nucleoside-diphosphate-sugar epimerase